jgi:hypothetical protein
MKNRLIPTVSFILLFFITAPDARSDFILSLVQDGIAPAGIQPVFACDDFMLFEKTDIAGQDIESKDIFPDLPGDYYVMRILDPGKLKELDGRVPNLLFGENAIFKTDPAGAEILPAYGWGLTRLSRKIVVEKEIRLLAPSVTVEYDPDIADMISDITAASCESTLTRLSSFATRYSFTDLCRQAEDTVYNRMDDNPLTPSYFDFSYWGTGMRDVIGELPGTVSPESVIVVCGHLDCTSGDPYNNAPGAEDNGSGSAAVLEAARVLSQYQPELTIRFITFSGEEQGLIGSDEYADSMQTAGEIIVAVINLDMVAYRGPYSEDMYIFSDQQSHWLGSLAAEVMSTYTSVDTVTRYETNPRYGSDHYSFAIRGYPAMFFIDGWDGPDWYPFYHTTADTVGNLDMQLLSKVTRTGAAMAAILARVDFGNPEPIPTLNEWGLLVLALVLVAAATVAILRRRKAAEVSIRP